MTDINHRQLRPLCSSWLALAVAGVVAFFIAQPARAQAVQQYYYGFPHVTFGNVTERPTEYWQTTYLLRNPSETPATVTLRHFADDGSELSVSIQGVRGVSHEYSIPANGTLTLTTDGHLEPTKTGWTAVQYTNSLVRGQAIFKYHRADGHEDEGIVPLVSLVGPLCILGFPAGTLKTTVPFDNASGLTGVAFANMTNAALTLQADVLNDQGARIGEISAPLQAFGHAAYTIAWTHAFTAGQKGMIVLKTPGVVMLALKINSSGSITTLQAE